MRIRPIFAPDGKEYYVAALAPPMFHTTARDRWKAEYRIRRMIAKGYPEHEINALKFEATWRGITFSETSE